MSTPAEQMQLDLKWVGHTVVECEQWGILSIRDPKNILLTDFASSADGVMKKITDRVEVSWKQIHAMGFRLVKVKTAHSVTAIMCEHYPDR